MVKKAIVFVFIFTLAFGITFAIHSTSYADIDCLKLNSSSSQSDRAYCQQQLNQIEAELQDLLAKQQAQKQQTGTLQGDVNYLNSQIAALQAKIKARSLAITQLKINIDEKTSTINSLTSKIGREQQSLAQLLRNTDELDNNTLIHLVLSDGTVSDFYSDMESYDNIKVAIKNSVDLINGVKTQTEVAKQDLQKQQDAETDAKAQLVDAQQYVSNAEVQKKQLLAASKQQEDAYGLLAAQKKAQADKIRAALFPLANTTQKIDFGTALGYANEVEQKLGVDPAFLLAILTQESNLGANVGQCYLSDATTGAGVGKNSGTPFANVMSPTRDVPVFLQMANDLGFNAFQTAVSCPIAGVVGYGGAMGPAQFIPSTWKLFASRLQSVLGHTGNPWSAEDSFMASGMYLSDLGAVGDSYSAQSRAACSYYGTRGSTCSYARSVMNLKASIQANINLL